MIKVLPFLFLAVIFCISICFGTKFLNPFSLIKYVFTDSIHKAEVISNIDLIILTKIRIPRALLSVLCGALLGGTGAMFQGFFRNPLADSGIMGISSGATLGAVCSGFFSFGAFQFLAPVTLFAFIGALVSASALFALSKIFRSQSAVTLLLSGTAIGTFFSAIASVILLTREKELHSLYVWTMGSFNGKGWNEFFVFVIPSVTALVLVMFSAKHLDVLAGGEMSAKTLGLNYNKVQNYILIAGSLATSCAVCAGGIISFVGLIAPHAVRKIYGPLHKTLIFESMIFGSILLLLSDTIARTVIAPSELAVGVITSLVGVPFFIVVLARGYGDAK
ncbi:MAG: iron ABC transporter permease [Treponema sp.]|nr:iron ABC transporter permease [Candidatus Treponema merdequi]